MVATSTCPRTVSTSSGSAVAPPDLRRDVERRQRHREHPPAGAEQASHPVEAVHVVVQQVPERDDEQVAHRVAVHLALGVEPVLEDLRPGLAPPVVAAEGGERHPQVAGRKYAELLAQPSRGAAVVRDRDDGGQVGR